MPLARISAGGRGKPLEHYTGMALMPWKQNAGQLIMALAAQFYLLQCPFPPKA
jgi:hypothetical protein